MEHRGWGKHIDREKPQRSEKHRPWRNTQIGRHPEIGENIKI